MKFIVLFLARQWICSPYGFFCYSLPHLEFPSIYRSVHFWLHLYTCTWLDSE